MEAEGHQYYSLNWTKYIFEKKKKERTSNVVVKSFKNFVKSKVSKAEIGNLLLKLIFILYGDNFI